MSTRTLIRAGASMWLSKWRGLVTKVGDQLGIKPKVHSMRLGPKISGVQLAFLSAWRRGGVDTLWHTGVKKSTSLRTVLLISALHEYANLLRWRTLEELLAYLRREFYEKSRGGAGPPLSTYLMRHSVFKRIIE